MTANEIELFNIVFENDHPEKAVMTAIEVFTAFLAQLEADQAPRPAGLQESA